MNQTIKLSNLELIEDGKLADLFESMQKAIISDCMSRPDVDKARSLSLKISYTPIRIGESIVDIGVNFALSAPTFPKGESFSCVAEINEREELEFSPESPDEPRQMNIDDYLAHGTQGPQDGAA